MQINEARRVLGLSGTDAADPSTLRRAYRRLIRHAHPDVNDRPDAGDRTARITLAYRVLTDALAVAATDEMPRSTRSSARTPTAPVRSRRQSAPVQPGIAVRLLDDQSISVGAPAEETLMLLLDTAHELGEISYLDRMAGLVEVIVEFVEAPTSSVLFSLQGRGDGTTEVFCTVEALSGGDSPPADAVTRLVVEALRTAQP